MVIERRSDLAGATILEKAMTYFAGGLGLEVVSESVNAISFEGEDGTVNITVSEEGPDSNVQLIAEGLEEHATDFANGIEGG